MNWEDLRVFLAVARVGSLSGAARQLCVDQTTISRRLSALEDVLGVRLVDRLPRASQLTAIGLEILDEVSGIEERSLAVARRCLAYNAQTRSKLTLSAPPILARHFIAPNLQTLSQGHPTVQLSILSEPRFVSLARMEADLALRLSAPIEESDIARKIGKMKFALYATPDYAKLESPQEWAFIGYNDRQGDFAHKVWLYELIGERQVVCEVADLSNQYEAACTGIGVAGLPCFLADHEPRLTKLRPASGMSLLELDIWIAKHPDRRGDRVVSAVSQALRALLDAHGLGLDQRDAQQRG
ncbi:LysR family transcriptional regulator [Pseudomonas sp. TE3610]